MMNEQKHALTPWKVQEGASRTIVAKDNGGCEVTRAMAYGSTPEEIEANAEFIVRACNSHDELMRALQECIAILEVHVPPGGKYLDNYLDASRAALTKAEGTSK